MQKIPLALAFDGMILAQEIKNPDNPEGPPLCGKGVVLNSSLIERLHRIGVQSITVEGHPVKIEGEKTLDEELSSLDYRFRKVKDDPNMRILREIYRIQIIKARQ